MAAHNELGKMGEAAAQALLKQKGHEIVVCNYRFGRAEIDIISKENGILIFTEVKTRSSEAFGYPEESVDRKKIRLMKQAAEEYMYQTGHEGELRFDIVSVIIANSKTEVHHIEDAFFYEEENE
ncbi:MAG: YraN family protein [Bacteroidetes bacterium]|nr:YraN family protein [Bacteroidota bacterium]